MWGDQPAWPLLFPSDEALFRLGENTDWFVFAQVGTRIKLVSTGFCGQKRKVDLKTERLPQTEIKSLFFEISG